MHRFSQEAIERPYRTLQAIEVMREKAGEIGRATDEAREDEVVVVVVRHDLGFGGVWTVAREGLAQQTLLLEDEGGWSFTFSPRTSLPQIEERCAALARMASKRGEAMQRWVNGHQ